MRSRKSVFYYLPIMVFVSFCLLFMTVPIIAHDEHKPAPQFLYRDDTHLVLLDGYTGEPSQLPFEVTDQDRFAWSPDGKYLLSRLHEGETYKYCLNLYEVDAQKWAYKEPISCAVGDALFSADGSRIVYTSNKENNGFLWLYSLADKKSRELYQTTQGEDYSDGISALQWSPKEIYLTFVDYHWIMGGTLNTFVVMNVKSQKTITITGGNSYYAYYHPIWSKDDRWFLISLKENYVVSGSLPVTNDEGDVYLVNSETGEEYRLTYTPADYESDIHWTDDGKIAFSMTTVNVQDFTYTPEQAMQIKVIPEDEIVYPEPIDESQYRPDPLSDVMDAPDPNLGAWVSSKYQEDGKPTIWVLNIGSTLAESPISNFSVPIPESYQSTNVLIGWRPSDYDYGGRG